MLESDMIQVAAALEDEHQKNRLAIDKLVLGA